MLIVLSPSKTLDYETPLPIKEYTQPALLKHSEVLITELRKYNATQLSDLMEISDKLSALNVQRYRDFTTPFTPRNARQALLAFKGDVYEGMDVQHYSKADFTFAQEHLRILSGLYGLLRPLDLMQPYRLEMGTGLSVSKAKDLYAFWGERITDELNAQLAKEGSGILINLASVEYFKAVRPAKLKGRVITIHFKERRGNKLQIIGIMAKRARGVMTDWIIRQRITNPKLLTSFNEDTYRFEPDLSGSDTLVFSR